MPLARGRSVRFGGLLHRDSIEAAPSGAASAYVRRAEPVARRSARYDGPVKVSVIVPVYNPGRDIERCIASVLDQSLPPTDYEAIFVDDGSTDDTPARLDRLAMEHPHIRVIHIPNSGWPGKPRNVGIDAARGTYVQLLDQDDHLGPEALERLYEMGRRNGTDIVIGKVTSDFRDVPFDLFARDREVCTLDDAPLASSMTAHKLFRRAFLQEGEVRFPEGRFVFEDHLFMVRAYFRVRAVSVLASYPCYFYCERRDGTNTMSMPMDPSEYYAQMARVIEEIRLRAPTSEARDRFLRRYHREMLGRLGDGWLTGRDPVFRSQLFEAIRTLDHDQFREQDGTALPVVLSMRSALLRSGRLDALTTLAERTGAIVSRCRIVTAAWQDGRLALTLDAWHTRGEDGPPLTLVRRGDRYLLDPSFTDGLLPDPVEVTSHLRTLGARVSVRHLDTAVEWRLPATATRRLLTLEGVPGADTTVQPRMVIRVVFDPLSAALGAELDPGRWEFRVRLSGFGFDRRGTIATDGGPAAGSALPSALLGTPLRSARPDLASNGLVIELKDDADVRAELDSGMISLDPSDGLTIIASLPFAASPGTPVPAMDLVAGPSRSPVLRTRFDGSGGQARLVARVGLFRGRLPRGTHDLRLRIHDGGPDLHIGTVETGRSGLTFATGVAGVSIFSGATQATGRTARSLGRRLSRRAPRRVKRTFARWLRRGQAG